MALLDGRCRKGEFRLEMMGFVGCIYGNEGYEGAVNMSV